MVAPPWASQPTCPAGLRPLLCCLDPLTTIQSRSQWLCDYQALLAHHVCSSHCQLCEHLAVSSASGPQTWKFGLNFLMWIPKKLFHPCTSKCSCVMSQPFLPSHALIHPFPSMKARLVQVTWTSCLPRPHLVRSLDSPLTGALSGHPGPIHCQTQWDLPLLLSFFALLTALEATPPFNFLLLGFHFRKLPQSSFCFSDNLFPSHLLAVLCRAKPQM